MSEELKRSTETRRYLASPQPKIITSVKLATNDAGIEVLTFHTSVDATDEWRNQVILQDAWQAIAATKSSRDEVYGTTIADRMDVNFWALIYPSKTLNIRHMSNFLQRLGPLMSKEALTEANEIADLLLKDVPIVRNKPLQLEK